MEPGLLDTLVKLAALGTSGVCIFAIFWIGWLILRLPPGATPERHKTLRMFMIITVMIALISGATGLVNARFNGDEISKLKEDAVNHESDFQTYRHAKSEEISEYKLREIETKNAAESLALVLESKEASNLRNPSGDVQIHIKLLKAFLKKMGVVGIKVLELSNWQLKTQPWHGDSRTYRTNQKLVTIEIEVKKDGNVDTPKVVRNIHAKGSDAEHGRAIYAIPQVGPLRIDLTGANSVTVNVRYTGCEGKIDKTFMFKDVNEWKPSGGSEMQFLCGNSSNPEHFHAYVTMKSRVFTRGAVE